MSSPRVSESSNILEPVLNCRSDRRKPVFSIMLQPNIYMSVDWDVMEDNGVPCCVDIHVCAPLVFQNLILPRPVYFKLSVPNTAKKVQSGLVTSDGLIEPLREAHVYTVGPCIKSVTFAVAAYNSPF